MVDVDTEARLTVPFARMLRGRISGAEKGKRARSQHRAVQNDRKLERKRTVDPNGGLEAGGEGSAGRASEGVRSSHSTQMIAAFAAV